MYRIVLFLLCMFFCSGCSWFQSEGPVSGRERVIKAMKPSTIAGGLLSKLGLFSTARSSTSLDILKPLRGLDPDSTYGGHPFKMELSDGTRVGGLFFEYKQETKTPKPLLMASFGFLQDRWGTEAAKFYELYLKEVKERIPAHVLILDHPTAGPFLANNGHLSMATYDDARMWIEVAQKLRKDMNLAGIHLFGVSMSGQTVVHALIEDSRLRLGLFQSGMAVSIAPDFHKAPGKQLAQLNTPPGIENPWKTDSDFGTDKTIVDQIQSESVWMLMEKQFIPHFQKVHPAGKELTLQLKDVAVFFRKACEDRITFLREGNAENWNHKDFSLKNLDSFISSTRIAGIINRVRTPLVLVSSIDDPAVDHSMFEEVMLAAGDNPWIVSYQTNDGGHFGFDVAYGKKYIGNIIRLMLDQDVLSTWNRPIE